MAGDWIKMRADLLTHPKVVRITSALKADRLRTVGGLMAVWCLFDAHSIDGKLDGYTVAALDDLIGWPGFSAEMIKVGWLESTADSLSTPRFDEHNGSSAKRRATETQRKRMARDLSAPDADEMRSREEKRREEKEITPPPPTGVGPLKPKATRRCPADFLVTSELQQWARDKAPLVDIRFETGIFRDTEFPKAHTDWPAAWRVWMAKEQRKHVESAKRDSRRSNVTDLETPKMRADRIRAEEISPLSARKKPIEAPTQPFAAFIDMEPAYARLERD